MMRRKQNDYGKRGKKSQRHRNDEEDEMIGFSFWRNKQKLSNQSLNCSCLETF